MDIITQPTADAATSIAARLLAGIICEKRTAVLSG